MPAVRDALARFDPLAGAGGAGLPYALVDVFTREPLCGNALAVFLDGEEVPEERMQRIAREMNLSETVFLLAAQSAGDARMRIFTPTSELPFAGHPVLGTAVLVAAAAGLDEVTLETGIGPVRVRLPERDGRSWNGTMSQPIPQREAFEHEAALLSALGVERSELPVEAYVNGPRHVYVALPDDSAVSAVRPDFGALADLGELGVSCFAAAGGHVRTRMFAPALGVAEDPATGSAAGPLAVHLARNRRIAYGEEVEISQGSEIGRPSLLRAVAHGSPERVERVEVSGWSVIAGAGRLAI